MLDEKTNLNTSWLNNWRERHNKSKIGKADPFHKVRCSHEQYNSDNTY